MASLFVIQNKIIPVQCLRIESKLVFHFIVIPV